jgi:RHS repeat-associated protein
VKAQYFLGGGRTAIKHNGKWNFYLTDGLGSTVMLADHRGRSVATWDYSDFGETRQTSGSTALYNPFLYTGQEYDFETSLYHLRARHYSPADGRFFSRDPIGYAGGSNMYAYCGADPVNFIDPSGLAGNWFGIGPAMPMSTALAPQVKATRANVAANLGANLDLFILSAHHYAVNEGIKVFGTGFMHEFVRVGDILNSLSRAAWPKITALNGCWTSRSLPGGQKPGDKVIVYTDDFTNGQLNALFQAHFYNFLQQGKTVAEAINGIYQITGNEAFHPIKGKYHFWGNGNLKL